MTTDKKTIQAGITDRSIYRSGSRTNKQINKIFKKINKQTNRSGRYRLPVIE